MMFDQPGPAHEIVIVTAYLKAKKCGAEQIFQAKQSNYPGSGHPTLAYGLHRRRNQGRA